MSIATEISRLQTAKANIKTSLENKGAIVPTETKLDNYPSIIDNLPSGGGRDWTEIGYSSEPSSIQDGFDYAKTIKDNWNSSVTSLRSRFSRDTNLIYMPLVDTSNVTDFFNSFNECYSLVEVPLLDTSNVTDMRSTFGNCSSLKKIPLLDTSKVTYMMMCFTNCYSLKTIPQLNTSSVTNMTETFNNCNNLSEIPKLNISNVTNITRTFSACTKLTTVPELNCEKVNSLNNAFGACSSLTNLGGLLNIGQNYPLNSTADNYNLAIALVTSPNLTHDSLMNVINKVYDIATKGVATQKIIIGSTNIAKLTAEEIAIATNKGWSVS